jgi:hypothetical protein
VFARALPSGAAEYVSRPPGSAPFLAPATPTETPETGMRTISADGRHVVFAGYSTRLPGNESGGGQVYRRDTLTGAIELVSRTDGGAPADSASREPSISADGRRVAFTSFAKLVAADTDAAASVYVRDLAAGTTTLVSRADGPDGAPPNQGSSEPRIGAGGHHVAFLSTATNLGAPDGKAHIYLRDLAAARTRLVDRATGAGGAIGNDDSDGFSVSADGQRVAFATRANNLDPSDPVPARCATSTSVTRSRRRRRSCRAAAARTAPRRRAPRSTRFSAPTGAWSRSSRTTRRSPPRPVRGGATGRSSHATSRPPRTRSPAAPQRARWPTATPRTRASTAMAP